MVRRNKELKLEGITVSLNELTQGDIINISGLSKDKNDRGQVYVDEAKFNVLLLTTSIKTWNFKGESGNEVLPITKESIEKLPVHVYKEVLDEAIQLNMTKKELDFLASRMQ